MTKRLDDAMTRLRSEGVTGVIPYVTIGFPSLEDTLSIVPALEQAGASVIELGVPYSDPLADGPTIHAASHRALESGINSHQCVDVVRRLREAGVTAPLLFMGYYNPILSYGPERYARDCAAAGLDGMMIPDLPPEESGPMRAALAEYDLALVPFVAPTSTDERIAMAVDGMRGFVYCVSVTGVTGARSELPQDLSNFVARVRRHTSLPIAVGFGVAEQRHVEAVGKVADAAIVGSALINVIDSAPPGERAARAGDFIASLTGRAR